MVLVTAASVQDRDGGRRVLDRTKMAMPSLAVVFAEGGYAGRLVAWARRVLRIVIDIVRQSDGQRGFAVLPRRWVVERTLAWLTAHRRLARDYERLPEHSEAWVKWTMIGPMTRRLARAPGRQSWQ
jgi:transposase